MVCPRNSRESCSCQRNLGPKITKMEIRSAKVMKTRNKVGPTFLDVCAVYQGQKDNVGKGQHGQEGVGPGVHFGVQQHRQVQRVAEDAEHYQAREQVALQVPLELRA